MKIIQGKERVFSEKNFIFDFISPFIFIFLWPSLCIFSAPDFSILVLVTHWQLLKFVFGILALISLVLLYFVIFFYLNVSSGGYLFFADAMKYVD